MKNKHIVFKNSPGVKKTRKLQGEKAELGFQRLLTDSGYSKKISAKIKKLYDN